MASRLPVLQGFSGADKQKKIKKRKNSSTKTGSSDRQVMLYTGTVEETFPGNMEDIKISIVNEQACDLKRKRSTAATPSSKRLRSAVFKCSTPSSASWDTSKSETGNYVSAAIPPIVEQNPDLVNEWDDSLLEPSDNEDDSPLTMSAAEMETLLEDDSCYAAEASGSDYESPSRFITLDYEKVSTSPYTQMDCSNTITEENEEDQSNYAAMAPSPSHSVICSVEGGDLENERSSSVSIEKGTDVGEEKTIVHEVSTSVIAGSDNKEALSCQLESDSLTNFIDQAISWYTVDIAVEWKEDPELTFDHDIDGLLAVSPRSTTSSEEEMTAEPSIQEQGKSVVPDPAACLQHLESVCADQTAPSACSNTTDIVQQLSPSTPNVSDSLKVQLPSLAVPEPLKNDLSSSKSTLLSSEPQLKTAASNVVQDARPSTSADIEENVTSTVDLANQLVHTSAELTSGNQQQITHPGTGNATSAPAVHSGTGNAISAPAVHSGTGNAISAPAVERPQAAVTAQPRPAPRPVPRLRPSISIQRLEETKNKYYKDLYMHIMPPNNSTDPQMQLANLANSMSRDQSWQHPSNFYKRNKNPPGGTERCTLSQWAARSGPAKRFQDIPRRFQRSPIPAVLPF
ncbi:S100P-binding protein-like isoform X2 [Hyperolius riggenbachi]|uniref:S100P-binding protein-like isoform X2 n=1 Tax=Hyperolius riggenbachi TaxID=752182 RepID=UPI0035A2A752